MNNIKLAEVEISARKRKLISNLVAMIVSASLFMVAGVCFLIDYFISDYIYWSMYVIGIVVVMWSTAIPPIISNKNRVFLAFVGFTITSFPYLYLVEYLSSKGSWFISLGMPILGVSIMSMWGIYILCRFTKLSKCMISVISIILFGVLDNLLISMIVSRFVNIPIDAGKVIIAFVSAIAAFIVFMVDYTRRKLNS